MKLMKIVFPILIATVLLLSALALRGDGKTAAAITPSQAPFVTVKTEYSAPEDTHAVWFNLQKTDVGLFQDGGVCYVEVQPVLELLGSVVFWNGNTLVYNSRDGAFGLHVSETSNIWLGSSLHTMNECSVSSGGDLYMPLSMLREFSCADNIFESGGDVYIGKYFATNEYHVRFARILEQIPQVPNYNPLNFQRYLRYQEQRPWLSEAQIVLYVNIGADREHYSHIEYIKDPDDVFAVFDKNHRAEDTYAPELTRIGGYLWREDAGEAWLEMKAAAKADGVTLTLSNTYRSVTDQKWNYFGKIQSGRTQENVDMTNSRPGHSEHHNGYTADIYPVGSSRYNAAYAWIAENSYKYGFIVSYQSGKEFLTGYSAEPWHIRWFPQWAADIMFEENLTLAELVNLYVEPDAHGYVTDLDKAAEILSRDYAG